MLTEAAAIQILKLQETQTQYTSNYDQFLVSTKTSGWTTCQEYTASLWIKKIDWSWTYDVFFRLSNDPS